MPRRTRLDELDRLLTSLNTGYDSTPAFAERFGDVDLDLVEHDDSYVVTIDLPGFERSDVTASIDERTLTVQAIRSDESNAGEDRDAGEFVRHERRNTTVRETVTFPVEVNVDNVRATMTNGVLKVTVPKEATVPDGTTIEIS